MALSRRAFVATGIGTLSLQAQKRGIGPVIERGFARVSEIAPGVYATIADAAKGDQCVSNGGMLAGRSAALIIEGHALPTGAALELQAAQRFSKAPIRGAVNTHFHLDHTGGNSAYAAQRIPILAHEKVGDLMKAQNATEIAAGADAADRPPTAVPTEPLSPDKLPMRIDLGGMTALIEFHPGHTATDLIVRVPEFDIVFTGDLLFNKRYPEATDANMIAWRGVLERLARYGRLTRFVPGHGDVCGLDAVREQIAIMDDLRAHAEKSMHGGVSAADAAKRYAVPKRFESYEINRDKCIGAALRSYYKGLKA